MTWRIRTLKPEFWTSQRVGSMSALARLTFAGLISMADDEGRGRSSTPWLIGQLHGHSKDVTLATFRAALHEISKARLVSFYGLDGQDYYAVRNFLEHQRIDKPAPSKLPPVPTDIPGLFSDSSESPIRTLQGGEGMGRGEGNGKGERGARPRDLEEVKTYWNERGLKGDPEAWFDHFTANGWMTGKTPMKDWKSSARNWSRREPIFNHSAAGNRPKHPDFAPGTYKSTRKVL